MSEMEFWNRVLYKKRFLDLLLYSGLRKILFLALVVFLFLKWKGKILRVCNVVGNKRFLILLPHLLTLLYCFLFFN